MKRIWMPTLGLALFALIAVHPHAQAVDALTGSLEKPNARGTVAEKDAPASGEKPASPEQTAAEIKYLLQRVETSHATFIRNGKRFPGKAAAAHMRRKYGLHKAEIASVEDFIRLCASRSEATGKPYVVETAPGNQTPCDVWMVGLLKEYHP